MTLEMYEEDGKVKINSADMEVGKLALFTGVLMNTLGMLALRDGRSMDEVKDGLWDIYTASCDLIEQNQKTEKGEQT